MEGVKIVSDNIISEDVLLCLKTLYGITQGTQPLARDMGIPADLVSKPTEVVKNEYALHIIEATEKYEPRVKVKEVTFESGQDGRICPIIHLSGTEE